MSFKNKEISKNSLKTNSLISSCLIIIINWSWKLFHSWNHSIGLKMKKKPVPCKEILNLSLTKTKQCTKENGQEQKDKNLEMEEVFKSGLMVRDTMDSGK